MSLINKMLKDLEARRKKDVGEKKSIFKEKLVDKKESKKNSEEEAKEENKEIIERENDDKKFTLKERSDKQLKTKKSEKSKKIKDDVEKFTLEKTKTLKKFQQPNIPTFNNREAKVNKKFVWKRYISLIVLLLILLVVIVALVFSAITFHARWGVTKQTKKVPLQENKIVQHTKAIAIGARAYKNQHQLTGEAKKAVQKINPEAVKQQQKNNALLQNKMNKLTASFLNGGSKVNDEKKLIKKGSITQKSDISVKKTMTPTELNNEQYKSAMSQLKAGSTVKAIEIFKKILVKTPDYKPARVALAATYIKQKKSTQAQKVLSIGLQQNPSYSPYAELQAHILVENDKVAQALKVLENAKPSSIAGNPNFFAFMAALYLQQAQYAKAAGYYQQLTQYNSEHANWWGGLAVSLYKLGERQKARNAYQKAQESDSFSPELASYLEQLIKSN